MGYDGTSNLLENKDPLKCFLFVIDCGIDKIFEMLRLAFSQVIPDDYTDAYRNIYAMLRPVLWNF